MNYKVTHTTRYTYSTPVRVCHNLVLLTPREESNVECHSHRLQIRPTPSVSARRRDFFGNLVHAFSIEKSHKQLSVSATSRVTVKPPNSRPAESSPAWEQVLANLDSQSDSDWLETSVYRYDSNRIIRHPEFAEYAQASFPPDRPIDEAIFELATRIHSDFSYDTQATNVNTATHGRL